MTWLQLVLVTTTAHAVSRAAWPVRVALACFLAAGLLCAWAAVRVREQSWR